MIKSKQLNWILSGNIRIANTNVTGGSQNITAALTTALSTAGRKGVAVPVQVSADEDSVGVITTGTNNLVQVQSNATKMKYTDTNGNEVYGRLTEAAGVYTVTFFTSVNGTETAYSFGSANAIDIDFNYRYDAARLPADYAIAIPTKIISQDPKVSGAGTFSLELLTVTATNTLAALAKTPSVPATVRLYVNGQIITSLGGASAKFSISGKTITWNATNAGYSLTTDDNVIAAYSSFE
jgi:hypothetical protein